MAASLDSSEVLQALRQVVDPELGLDIVELGMVRNITEDDSGRICVSVSLTTVACPFWDLFEDQIRIVLGEDVTVRFKADPPWRPDMMSDEARRDLSTRGLLSPSATLPEVAPWPSKRDKAI